MAKGDSNTTESGYKERCQAKYKATYDGGGATDYYVHDRSNTTSKCYTYIRWATTTPTCRIESINTPNATSSTRGFDRHCRAEETVGEGARTPPA